MKNLQLLGEIIGVLDRNGFHLHASQMQASIERNSITEQQAAVIVGSVRGVVLQPARAESEGLPIPPTNQPIVEARQEPPTISMMVSGFGDADEVAKRLTPDAAQRAKPEDPEPASIGESNTGSNAS